MEADKVIASTYVSPKGRMLDKFIYKLDANDEIFVASDIRIAVTNKQVNFKTKEAVISVFELKIERIIQDNGELIIDIEDIPFDSIIEIKISDDKNRLNRIRCKRGSFGLNQNSEKEQMTVLTQYADEFEKSIFTDSKGTQITYWLYTPKKIAVTPKPLIIWEHTGGEVLSLSFEGANLVANQGATTWLEHQYDALVLSVQYPENYSFGISDIPEELSLMEAFNDAKYELIQSLIHEEKVAANRITITGASSGGGGAIRFLMQYPDLFAGALIVSAKDTLIPISKKYDLAYQIEDNSKLKITQEQYRETYNEMQKTLSDYRALINVPIWFVQAENDQITTYYTAEIMEKILRQMGATHNKITLYSDEEMEAAGLKKVYHGSWEIVYQNKEMLDWLVEQSRY
ncbi:prolyl oligopeptidase family serine peptidase [Aerococcaceae bacterium zg-B36]|uniref:prolyl oligopeptidase family serine peptidase n=1 Tax=Aerococcaceae bacterium zg-252 TaxID=2796928 RepID=UPI001BD87987|nr:prolyl oligopeptidase family serine peptidase [Aerococcaceae bacterium zg-B36]